MDVLAASRLLRLAFVVAWVSLGAGGVAQDRASRLNEDGIRHLEEKRYAEAIDAFQEALAARPTSETIRKNLAGAWLHRAIDAIVTRRFADAKRCLGQSIGIGGHTPRTHFADGYLAFRRTDYATARRKLEAAVEGEPDYRSAWEILGHVRYRLDALDETVTAWERAQALRRDARLEKLLTRVRAETRYGSIVSAGRSAHFRIRVDRKVPGIEAIAHDVLRMLEAGYDRVCSDLGFHPRETTTAVLLAGESFSKLMKTHRWVAGTFDGARIRIAVRDFAKQRRAIERTLAHEYAHMVVHRLAAGARVPAWIDEGYARLAEGRTRAEMDAVLAKLGGQAALAPIEWLAKPFVTIRDPIDARRAYAQAGSFAAFLAEGYSTRAIGRFIKALGTTDDVDRAFRRAFGVDLDTAFDRWKNTIR